MLLINLSEICLLLSVSELFCQYIDLQYHFHNINPFVYK